MDESDTLKQVYHKFGNYNYVEESIIEKYATYMANYPLTYSSTDIEVCKKLYQCLSETTFKTVKIKEEGLKMLTETLKALCIDNCKDGVGCYRLFTCDSWPNSKLYAVGPKKIWFDRQGKPKVKDSGNYDLSVCENYCNRKRNPWREVKTLEEVKKLYV